MLKKHKKRIITAFMCFTIAIILAQIAPSTAICNTAKAAEITEFQGASGKSGALTWEITAEGHLTIEGTGDYERNYKKYNGYYDLPEWLKYSDYIKTTTINVQNITSTEFMFYDCSNLISLDLIHLNTDKVTNMQNMFAGCSSLTNLDLTYLNTNNVYDMTYMFSDCSNLTNLDLTPLNTNNVTRMWGIFENCSSLTNLDLTPLETDNVTNMTYMFHNCSNLTNLDLTPLNTNNVIDMWGMFEGCSSLTSLDLTPLNTNKVTRIACMFAGCSSLTNLDLTPLNTDNVTDMCYMFSNCKGLTNLDLTPLNTNNATDMDGMFAGCSNLTNLDLTPLNTNNVTNMRYMFSGCSNLTSLNLTPLNTDNVTDMDNMFSSCSSLTSLDLTPLNTDNVIDMESIFLNCSSLTNLDLTPFNTNNVTNMRGMFYGCSSLVSLDLTPLNTNNVTNMQDMFYGCSSLVSLNLSSFNTNKINNVEDYNYYFSLDNLCSLEKLNFFANSSREYDLPYSDGYYWVNDNQEIVTKTASFTDRKINYSKLEVSVTPTLIPTSAPSPSVTTLPVIPSSVPVTPTSSPVPNDDINTGIYADSACASLASISARTLFVYGGNVKQTDGSKVNYKTRTYYIKLQASNIVTVNKKGKTRTKKGKLVVGVTSTYVQPSIVKNKVNKDVAASKIAKVSISKGKVKVTAQKESGVVYVWVMDTGNAGACVCAKFVVNAAPSKLQVFARASSDAAFSADKKNVYKKDVVEIGNSVKIYVYPTYKQNGQFKETKDASYSASVNSQAASYFTVVQDENNPYCFIVTANGLKNNKKTTGKVTIKCNENGKKTVFTAAAVNSIQSISYDSVNAMTLNSASGEAITSYVIERSDTDKKTGSFVISTSKSSDSFDTTDKVKLYAMSTADGFDKSMMEKGKVKITSKPSGNQKKLTAKIGSDKKTVNVTADKKIPAQTSVYYLIFYNNKQGKGYNVVKITTK